MSHPSSNLIAQLRSSLNGYVGPVHDGETVKAKCAICGNFNRFWYIIEACNFCQSCVSEALSGDSSPPTIRIPSDPNSPATTYGLPVETSKERQRKEAKKLIDWLPITTPELIRLRNANAITFGKQANAITTCLIQLRELFAGSPEETSAPLPTTHKPTCEGGTGGPCTQPDCEKCWDDEGRAVNGKGES